MSFYTVIFYYYKIIEFNTRIFLALTLLLFSINLAVSVAVKQTSGYVPIEDLNSTHVRSIAEFAVNEYNKLHKDSLIFLEVFGGQKQIVEGTNYKLDIKVRVRTHNPIHLIIGQYTAVVHEGLPGTNPPMKLVSFEPISNEFTPINNPNDDPHVKFIAEFAVNEYNARSGKNVVLLKVEKAQKQVFAIASVFNYKLLLATEQMGGVGNVLYLLYEASVFEGFPNTQPALYLNSFTPIFLYDSITMYES